MSREVTMPQGRHRPKTYTLPLAETWETMRQAYPKPTRWAWLTKWMRR
jgi:hypothetical protein